MRIPHTELRQRNPWTVVFAILLCILMPAAWSATRGEYRLGEGDQVQVVVWKEPDLSQTVVIRPDGKISLPMAGEFQAEGKTAAELRDAITTRLRKYLVRPVVDVIVKEINSSKIFVLGKVRKPDVYAMKGSITVLDALALAGGLRDDSRGHRVLILRNAEHPGVTDSAAARQRIELDLKRLIRDHDSGQIHLQPYDTVYVPD